MLAKALAKEQRMKQELDANLKRAVADLAETKRDLMERLTREELARADLQSKLDALQAQHDKCPGLIAALRKQIKETKDALELDDGALHVAKAVVEAETIELEKHLQTRVKSADA